MKKFYIFLLINIIALPLLALENDNKETNLEDNIKAVFIYNFTKYIQWPNSDTSRTFEIAIIGDSNIIIPLKEIAEKKLVDNRKIEIKHCQDIQDINMCHILFISASEKKRLHEILQKVKNRNILTISDCNGFAEEGVAINFVIIEGKVKFEISSGAINNAGLKVSSQLLKLAILVGKKEGQ